MNIITVRMCRGINGYGIRQEMDLKELSGMIDPMLRIPVVEDLLLYRRGLESTGVGERLHDEVGMLRAGRLWGREKENT